LLQEELLASTLIPIIDEACEANSSLMGIGLQGQKREFCHRI
jgi:hypothetical protein